MKKGFVCNEFLSKRNIKTPKVSDLSKKASEGNILAEPRQSVLDMDWECRQWLCVVVKTNISVVRKPLSKCGQFGHQCYFDTTDAQHRKIEQLSWAHGTFDEAKDQNKQWDRYLTWSMKAQRCDLRTALVDLLNELKRVLDKGGRICMYDIEFEAGAVMEALRALQLPNNYLSRWHDAAAMGKALLNADLLQWVFNYPSNIELVELQKFCEHTLGKTVHSSEPGLQCWMLLRKMYFKVHEHKNKTKKRVLDTDTAVNILASDNVPKRPRGFSIDHALQPQKKTTKAPKACNIVLASLNEVPAPLAPSKWVQDLLLPEPTSLLAIDIETHTLIPKQPTGSWWQEGRLGIESTVCDNDISALRAVQIGWTKGAIGSHHLVTKVRVIRPDGYTIDEAASAMHKITQATAVENGLPLNVVLKELVSDAEMVYRAGGRLCSHHFALDAGIIAYELERACSEDIANTWVVIARQGICTMHERIGHWVRAQLGIHDKPMKIPLRLKDGITGLLPHHNHLLNKHHDAGVDSHMHWLFANDLIARAKSGMA